MLTYIILLVICTVVDSQTDPCIGSIDLGNDNRLVYYETKPTDICDNGRIMENLWYNFISSTGNQMTETCTPVSHCGTYLTIHMMGTHPNANTPGPMNRTACINDGSNCCSNILNILVKYCSSEDSEEYYVYKLQNPPSCPAAYCTVNDTNECLVNNGGCRDNCINTHGSYVCTCNTGYSLEGDKQGCTDNDECKLGHNCSQICVNTIGSYNCNCCAGYKLGADKATCEVISEYMRILCGILSVVSGLSLISFVVFITLYFRKQKENGSNTPEDHTHNMDPEDHTHNMDHTDNMAVDNMNVSTEQALPSTLYEGLKENQRDIPVLTEYTRIHMYEDV